MVGGDHCGHMPDMHCYTHYITVSMVGVGREGLGEI